MKVDFSSFFLVWISSVSLSDKRPLLLQSSLRTDSGDYPRDTVRLSDVYRRV